MHPAKTAIVITFLALLAAPGARAQTSDSAASLLPEQIIWKAMPSNLAPGADSALLTGALGKPGGLYTIRFRLAKGGKVMPHVHPDNRYITVLSGDLYSSRSERGPEENLSRYPAGSYYTVPAGGVHFVLAKDVEVVFQESGIGPTESLFLKK